MVAVAGEKGNEMGEKGARLTGTEVEVGDALVDELAPLGDVRAKKMFGGVGVFADDVMFVIIDSAGKVFLRANDETSVRFEEAGGEKHGRMPYYSVPETVLADEHQLGQWAAEALSVAAAAKK